jgi:beta-lactamase class A
MRPDPSGFHRRRLIGGALALCADAVTYSARAAALDDRFRAIEARMGGRLGLWAGAGGRSVAWRADERFLMCSTFKALAVAALLARTDRGQAPLDRRIAYGPGELLAYAPVTKAHLAEGGMTLEALCAAAIEVSDNTAANLILRELGGPAAVTGYARSLGDGVTRLDRTEPTLNDPGPAGDRHDTTTPATMAGLWRRIVLGEALKPASRDRLTGWLKACKTGQDRLMAITPPDWSLAHKTGSGRTTIGDVGVLFPPRSAPVLIAAYFEARGPARPIHDAVIAEAGRLALASLGHNRG